MTVNNLSFSNVGFNRQKMEDKTVEISSDEKVKQEEKTSDLQKLQEKRKSDYDNAMMQLEHMREQKENGNTEGDMMADYGKLLKIAMRIMNGDYVPLSDKKKLAEAMPDLYKQAEMMKRTDNDDPKKYKKEFEDEEDKDAQEMLMDKVENKAAETIATQTLTPSEAAGIQVTEASAE